MPLLLFRPQFILMSHFKMAAEKQYNHIKSEIVYMQTQQEALLWQRDHSTLLSVEILQLQNIPFEN